MKGPHKPSAELEAALVRAVDAMYGPGTVVDFSEAGDAVRDLLEADRRDPGSPSQQLALGTVILDMNPPSIEDEEELADGGGTGALPERIMSEGEGGLEGNRILDSDALSAIAVRLLAERKSARDAVMAYCALRLNGQVPAETGEMHALNVARGVAETDAITDRMTRTYSRRVIVLVAGNSDEVFAAVRQAQDEGNPLEVYRLVEAGYGNLSAAKAMSLVAMGVNAADDMEDPVREMQAYWMLLDVVSTRLHEVRHGTACDEVFERSTEGRQLAGELALIAKAFERFEGNEQSQMVALTDLAIALALLHECDDARETVNQVHALAAKAGMPGGLVGRLHIVDELLLEREGRPTDQADEHEAPPPPPDEDDPTTRADWWKNN